MNFQTKLLIAIGIIGIAMVGIVYLTYNNTSLIEILPFSEVEMCVPNQACHATACIPQSDYIAVGGGIKSGGSTFCSTVCSSVLDCGYGTCAGFAPTNTCYVRPATCGNGECVNKTGYEPETIESCPEDCLKTTVCGDTVCNGTESSTTCLSDCPIPTTVCGDTICNGTETETTCSSDCVVIPSPTTVCGDTVCNGTETETSCVADCKTEPCVGCDTDEHGCVGSAGYTWCDSLGKCIRPWIESCSTPNTEGGPVISGEVITETESPITQQIMIACSFVVFIVILAII